YARYMKGDQRYPKWLENPSEVWKRGLVPVSLMLPSPKADEMIREWARSAASDQDSDAILDIVEMVNRLKSKFTTYNIPFLSLPTETDRETALNVFIRMNTSASPLSNFDIVVAQVEAKTEMSMHDLVGMLTEKSPNLEHYGNTADLMLATSALLQDKPPTKTTYLGSDFADRLIEDWENIEIGVKRAIAFLEEEFIYDGMRLPTDVVLHPLAALWANCTDGLDEEGETRTILRKYLWRAAFTDRYDRSSATRVLVDYRSLRKILDGDTFQSPIVFDEELYPLPTASILKTAGWPKRKDRMARGILAISFRFGAVDFADARPVSRDSIQQREYHHLFPRRYLQDTGVPESHANLALNCALVTWKTNRMLAAKSPESYILERAEQSSLGKDEVRRRIETHLIPYEQLMDNDYEEFLEVRSVRLNQVLKRLCDGEYVASAVPVT
ncbi:MAG: hypothetical protein OEU92_27700, partial [Alphaproteobacteria bacterium]|nr:hypothetical protein [Alphaproteobacteria bacterium]